MIPARLRIRRFALLAGVALTVFGCASSGSGAGTNMRNVAAAEELATAGDINLYDALARLRPTFLRARPAPGTAIGLVEPTVYLDGLQMREGLEALKSINVRSIQEVRFLEAQQANARFGTSNNAGALIVSTKK